MIIAVWDSKSNSAVYTIWLDPGAIIGVGDSKSGVHVACENIRFSSLLVAGDVSRGGTSVTQRQKFHTDDVKSVRNPVRSADWSTQQLHCFSYCL